jgi:hypothetical protein
MSENKQPIDPNHLSIEQAAKLLSAAYRERIEIGNLQKDVDVGSPTNPDGTINLVNYSAWQAKELGNDS